MKQPVNKVYQVSAGDASSPLFACAGLPSYIQDLRHCIVEECLKTENKDYREILKRATRTYSKDFASARREVGLSYIDDFSNFASAIFVGHETTNKKAAIYVIQPPQPPFQVYEYPYRATVGTGGIFASVLLSTAEYAMDKIQLYWPDLSTILVAQFCYFILGRVISSEGSSGLGTSMYRMLDSTGLWEGLGDQDVFRGHGRTGLEFRLTLFAETLANEIPPEKFIELAKRYRLADVLKKIGGQALLGLP
jgi:hypothetical protein